MMCFNITKIMQLPTRTHASTITYLTTNCSKQHFINLSNFYNHMILIDLRNFYYNFDSFYTKNGCFYFHIEKINMIFIIILLDLY